MDISTYQQLFNTFIQNVDDTIGENDTNILSMQIIFTKKSNPRHWFILDDATIQMFHTVHDIFDIHSLEFIYKEHTFLLSFNTTFNLELFEWITYALENIYDYYRDVSFETNIQKKCINQCIEYITYCIEMHDATTQYINPSVSIHNLPNNTTYDEIKALFGSFGEIKNIILHQGNNYTTTPKHSIVSYIDPSSAELCAKTMDNYMYSGHMLDVKLD